MSESTDAALPADPLNLDAPPNGKCLERIHSAMLPMVGPGGRPALQQVSYYPDVAANQAACSHFALRVVA